MTTSMGSCRPDVGPMLASCLPCWCRGAGTRRLGGHDVLLNVVHGFARNPLPVRPRRQQHCQSQSPLRTLSGRGMVEKGGRDRKASLPGQRRGGNQECCWGMSTSIGLCGPAETGARIRAFVVAVSPIWYQRHVSTAASLTAPPGIYGT